MEDLPNETNQFAEFESYDDLRNLDTNNLLTEVWLKPKLVFKYLFKTNPEKYIWPLMVVAGMANSFDRSVERAAGNSAYAIGYIFGGLLAGALLGWISFYISAWVLSLFGGGFLGGKAKPDKFRTVLAWGSIPSTASVVFSFLIVVLYGVGSFGVNAQLDYVQGIVFVVFGLIQIGLSIWSIYIMVQGIMHIQNFGTGKALLNLFLPIIFLILLFAVIFGLASLF